MLAGAAAAGCDDARDTGARAVPTASLVYGDPVGVRLDARPPVPALAVSLAISKGRDPGPSVASFASALGAAAASCPTLIRSVSEGETVRLELEARSGAFEVGAAAAQTPSGCMAAALSGKPLQMDRPDRLDLVVDIKRATTDVASSAAK